MAVPWSSSICSRKHPLHPVLAFLPPSLLLCLPAHTELCSAVGLRAAPVRGSTGSLAQQSLGSGTRAPFLPGSEPVSLLCVAFIL